MKTKNLILSTIIITIYHVIFNDCFAQSRIILNNNGYAVIDNGAILVIDNPNTNALITQGTGGNIISENELDRIKWNIGANTGAYNIPWTTNTNIKIPLRINKTTAGTGAGSFILSTWETATDMNTPWPSAVTNMNSSTVPATDGSLEVVDRFWHIDARSYTTKPSVTIAFNYDGAANEIAGTNTINEANLQAQRFNTGTSNWEATKLFGTVNTAANVVFNATVAPADFFEDWILVDNANPLPVTLTNFSAECITATILVAWTTETEINNDYFVVEKSYNGVDFSEITRVEGNGNSNVSISYQVNVEAENSVVYYRLKQVDFDGQYEYSNLTSCNCNNLDLITIYPNPSSSGYIDYAVSSNQARIVTVSLINDIGQQVMSTKEGIESGMTKKRINTSSLSKGNYLLMISSGDTKRTQKQFIIN